MILSRLERITKQLSFHSNRFLESCSSKYGSSIRVFWCKRRSIGNNIPDASGLSLLTKTPNISIPKQVAGKDEIR